MDSLDDLERRIKKAREGHESPAPAPRLRSANFDRLVEQYDRLAFVRELTENSMDAGAARIDLSFDWESFAPQRGGCVKFTVRDDGHGMDREIIDTKLTRLFASSRPDRFGYGFLSIFAFQPEAVVVDTQEWRAFFHGGREKRFDLIPMDRKAVGTSITLIKMLPGDSDFAQLKRELYTVASEVARYSEVATYFEGQPLAEEFSSTEAGIHRAENGFRLVLEPSTAPGGRFYSRGLLIGTVAGPYKSLPSGWAFRLDHRGLCKGIERRFPTANKTFHRGMRLLQTAAQRK